MRWWLLLFLGLVPATASAAACCMSASVAGTGRLLNWEDAAAGIATTYGHDLGRFDSGGRFRAFGASLLEDEVRVEAWGIVRLHERWQLSARVPWVTGVRASGDVTSVGTGIGDVSAAVRWEAISLGEYEWVPGVALLAQVTTPTGRRPEQAIDPLGASATGRGAWAASLGLTLETTKLPWFVRLDAAVVYTAPFVRADTKAVQGFGPGMQLALSGGREFFKDRLVLARSEATVFVFWSAGCPCVRRYEDRVQALTAAWAPKSVAVVQVSSNAGEALESLPTSVWRDEGGKLAKQLKARSTPMVVLVRRDGEVLFRGWIDNERQPGERGPSKSPSWGCPITLSLGGS